MKIAFHKEHASRRVHQTEIAAPENDQVYNKMLEALGDLPTTEALFTFSSVVGITNNTG